MSEERLGEGEAMQILIVEDDFTSRSLLQRLLSPYGECHIAVNGEEAVEAALAALAQGSPYDLICLDIMMPKMDGQVALKKIRAAEEAKGILLGQGTKIVMTTALRDSANVIQAFREMCDGYLTKPIEKEKLLALMRKLGLFINEDA